MRWYHSLLVGAVALAVASPAPAGGLFARKKQPNPAQRVPELIAILKTEKDDRKRADAAEELLGFDAAAFPEIVPILIDVLQSDAKTPVRLEAAHSLGKLRPASIEARQALEKAASNDSALRVRLQARTVLFFYPSVASANRPTLPPTRSTTDEPPLADPTQGPKLTPPPITINPNDPLPVSSGLYRPLPVGPTLPASAQTIIPPPKSDGPTLGPPR